MKAFDELKVSTRTIIASANIDFEIEKIFNEISLENAVVFSGASYKTRIDMMYYKDKMRSLSANTHGKTAPKKSFRNALNVIMFIDDNKKINFKISKNGKFQITGCKDISYAKIGVFSFIESIGKITPALYDNIPNNKIRVFFEIVMTNVDCGIGYCINRKALDTIINTKTGYNSLLETSFGYTGVNIKFPVSIDWYELQVPVLEWTLNTPADLCDFKATLESLKPRPENIKKKYNTFLVFHSGQFIMSGMHEETMRDDYTHFMDVLTQYNDTIKEKLNTL
jgi:TATA-box binding protein (TBP) (component of TFIID and TFIIIB)